MSRVAIIGAGAMGSVYAALMADAGHEVYAVTLWADHVAAMQEKGLRLSGYSGDRTVRLHASTSTDGMGVCDLVIIASKGGDVEAAARAALTLCGEHTVVQTIQNGLGSADRVAPIVGADRLAVGVVGGFGASLVEPGHVHHNGMAIVRFGAYAGLQEDRLDSSAEVWRSSGFTVSLFADLNRMIWEKLLVNVAFSATCALSGRTIGEVIDDPDLWSVAGGCAAEAAAVAAARGIDLQVGDPVEHVRKIGSGIRDARPSLLLDHLAGRRSEIDVINGSIPREAAKVGAQAPINATVTALVLAAEKSFQR
ncbi:ketopantoate reductase family protein [Nocardia jiangxiensis]|uniref:2-dehydropantoate 2-reductase n=1 Tax=Nocardia jiangxiensis TaxID=282685 RepID=A0ABW6RTY9_9NOCA|nr:2-dehydropantoate 2-reductase [Nocardia jiangxiensis]